jgi:hypothetical protein
MNYITAILCTALTAIISVQAGENLVFNSGFELGNAGYSCTKYLRPDTNPELKYAGPVADNATRVTGKLSLRIPNRFSEEMQLYSREVCLVPGREYTASLWMKSDIEHLVVNVIMFSIAKGKWDTPRRDFEVGREWKRFSFTFTAAHEYYSFRVGMGDRNGLPACDLWLDNLQINKGPLRDYEPCADIEATTTSPNLVLLEDGKLSCNVELVNNSANASSAKMALDIINDGNGEKSFSKLFDFNLKPGERTSIPCQIPLNGYGAYLAQTTSIGTQSFNSLPGYFAVIGNYERKNIDLDKTFCVGLNNGSGYFIAHDRSLTGTSGYLAVDHDVDAHFALLAKMGCRLIRDGASGCSAFSWRMCEPKEGEFKFQIGDRLLELSERHGMKVMPILGGSDFINPPKEPNLPEWLKNKSKKQDPIPVDIMQTAKGNVYLPPLELWRKFIRETVTHCKGKVSHYEIMNEPNLFLSPTEYLEYLKAANEEIRGADPKAKTVGFCATGDLGGNVDNFMNGCIKQKGLPYADIVSFHPYDARDLKAILPADKQIDGIKAMLSENQENRLPLWNTELFFLFSGPEHNSYEAGVCQPQHIAMRFLTDLGEGLGQSLPLPHQPLWKPLLNPHTDENICNSLPSANFVAYNALARLFEGAKPLDKIRWGNDTICYVYEKDGRPLAAFWNYGDTKELKLKLEAKSSDLQLFDLFGNEISFPEDGIIKFGPAPFYLTTKAKAWFNLLSSEMSTTNFDAMLKNGQVEAELPVAVGTGARFVPQNGGWALVVPFRNCTGRDLPGKIGVRGEGLVGAESVSFTVPANGELAIAVPVKLKTETPGPVSAKFALDGKIWTLPLKIKPPGKLLRPGDSARLGSSSMNVSCNDKTLKISFAVNDTSPSGYVAGREPWEQDCIELFIDANPEFNQVKYPETYTDKVARLFVMPYAPEGQRMVLKPGGLDLSGVTVATATQAGGYTAEVEIPLAALGGTGIGFEAQIDDADTVKRQSSANWNSNGDAYKNRLSFGFITFK